MAVTNTAAAPANAPQFTRGHVLASGYKVELYFNKELADDADSLTSLARALTVTADGETVALTPSNPIQIENLDFPSEQSIVTIVLGAEVESHRTVTVSYAAAQAGAHPLRGKGSGGANVADFTETVANKTSKAGAPAFRSAAVNGTQLAVRFDEYLLQTTVPGANAFAVTVNGAARAVGKVGIAGPAVTLTLASAVLGGETVTVGYTRPPADGTARLKDEGGAAVASFGPEPVENMLGGASMRRRPPSCATASSRTATSRRCCAATPIPRPSASGMAGATRCLKRRRTTWRTTESCGTTPRKPFASFAGCTLTPG